MNLILSGPIDAAMHSTIATLVKPMRSTTLRDCAWRLENVIDSPLIRVQTEQLCLARQVDHAFVSHDQSFANFRLLAIDMDSTLINIECIDELADLAGVRNAVAAITEAAMQGHISDFSSSLKQRVQLLRGLHTDALREVYETRLKLTDGATNLITKAKAANLHVLLVSGGFTYFTERLKTDLGLDEAHANTLEIADSRLTGSVAIPIFDSAAKAREVAKSLQAIGASTDAALVIGDGANDIPMMALAKTSVAFHAKPTVRAAASAQVNFGNLDVILDYYG